MSFSRAVGTSAIALAVGCSASPPRSEGSARDTSHRPAGPDPLVISADAPVFKESPALLRKVRGSPSAYFRYVGGLFAEAICDQDARSISHMPTVNLHGDLHLEQFAVADDGYGIVDFDDSTDGPPVLDWLRFGASIVLAAGADTKSAETALKRFIEGYRSGIADPDAFRSAPEPAAAKKIHDAIHTTPTEWLDEVTAMMTPIAPARDKELEAALKGYVSSALAQAPDLTPGFFDVKRLGGLNMGIGSALQAKYLARVEGPTPAPDDDVILEIKQMKRSLLGKCVRGDPSDPTRVIKTQAKFAPSAQRFLGHLELGGETYYVHAWRVHYTELRVEKLAGAEELAELAHYVGLQLGRGHPLSPVSSEHGAYERTLILEALADFEPKLVPESIALARRIQTAFARFAPPQR